ncbi:MAG: hypothetical protein R2860_08640 [Desulfobacterales bacterium]
MEIITVIANVVYCFTLGWDRMNSTIHHLTSHRIATPHKQQCGPVTYPVKNLPQQPAENNLS